MEPFARPLALAAFVVFAGLAGFSGLCGGPATDAFAAGPALPKAATPQEVATLLAKPPAGLEIVDLRPQAHFAEYSLPGSLNLEAGVVLTDPSLLAGTAPLVLVDADGSSAFAVAGALAQKTQRPVWALTGGLAAWWAATEKGVAVRATALTGTAAPMPGAKPGAAPAASPTPSPGQGPQTTTGGAAPGAPAPAQPPQQIPGAPKPPISKNAGC